ncbi:amidase [Spirillospora sp. CA-294931]|uniref:amidase n=1 Tax=Spirillospora sp. CA-294931 TaxID=3240042 RepID=UPI003D900042
MSANGIRETRRALARGETTVAAHIASVLERAAGTDRDLGAFFALAGDAAMAEAEAADALVRERGPDAWRGLPLLGVPVAVKDLIRTWDLPTTRGSLLSDGRPRTDAPAVARLRGAGAIVIGKTATSEHGWSASTVGPVAAPTRNPWDHGRSAGGSSGGSAAAVAAGLCPVALGTDGAGSIRIPAAFCGVVGFKPSFGRVPYVPPCADRLSHLGPLAGTAGDAAELMEILARPHPADPDSRGPHDPGERSGGEPLRIGWIEFPGTAPEVREVSERVWPVLAGQGARLEGLDVPFADPYPALVDVIAAAEAAGTAPEDEARCDPGRLAVVRYGRTVSGAAMIRAEEARTALRAELHAMMDRYDLLAMATVPVEPYAFDAIAPEWAADPADLLWLAWSPATYPFNLTGQPAVSLPAGLTSSGHPVGVQLVGRLGADDLVLAAARRIEAELGPLPAPARHVLGRVR